MKLLLVYPPFCTPVTPPYSITNIYNFMKNNLNKDNKVEVIDLNIEFHKLKFPNYQKYFKNIKEFNKKEYELTSNKFIQESKQVYSKNNKLIIKEEQPELFKELLQIILNHKPDVVGLSIVYSSQVFYAYSLIKELKKHNIKTIVGGPALSKKLKQTADLFLNNEIELLEEIQGKINNNQLNKTKVLDFSIYNLNDYFSPEIVLPLKTASTCYYQQCTFCTHHNNQKYCEFELDDIKQTILNSKTKYFFVVDDMIHKERLLNLAKIFKETDSKWACQLKPTIDLDKETLNKLKESGLNMIMWGFESASNRILNLIKKGTNIKDITQVLKDSKNAGINNILYVMFGFPTETKEEFYETLNFLKENEQYIDLISTTTFGLQRGTDIFNNPSKYKIKNLHLQNRTLLDEKINYELEEGLTQEEVEQLIKENTNTIQKINKFPRTMNFFREHMLIFSFK